MKISADGGRYESRQTRGPASFTLFCCEDFMQQSVTSHNTMARNKGSNLSFSLVWARGWHETTLRSPSPSSQQWKKSRVNNKTTKIRCLATGFVMRVFKTSCISLQIAVRFFCQRCRFLRGGCTPTSFVGIHYHNIKQEKWIKTD